MRNVFLIVGLALCMSTASAQLQPPAFLPRDCQSAAVSQVASTLPNASVVAIATVAVQIPFGGTSLSIGIDLTNGRSEMWAYSLYSPQLDSSVLIPMVRLFTCSDLRTLFPGELPAPDELDATTPLPATYLQGTDLISALNGNSTYAQYRASFPDSIPAAVVLANTPEEVGTYPAGTPFWILLFAGETAAENMTCLVHATDGFVECIRIPVSTVNEITGTSLQVTVAPNPASDVALVSIPTEWSGRRVDLVVVDAAGREVSSYSVVASAPQLLLPVQKLVSGSYSIRVQSRNEVLRAPFHVVR